MRSVSLPEHVATYLTRPITLFKEYDRAYLRQDLLSGLTVGVILLPQGIAFALIAELPPAMGLYAAIIGAIVGGLWGCSNQMHTGPANAISLLVFSSLLSVADPGTGSYIVAAGMVAVMAGILQLILGLARLGMLINFVSHSVIVGFASGAGVLIIIKQLRPLLGVEFESGNILVTIRGVISTAGETHLPTAAVGVGTILFVVAMRRINPRLPSMLLSMILAALAMAIFNLEAQGVAALGQLGELPRGLPPLTSPPLFDLEFIARLSTGALAIGAIGLVETAAIAKSISASTGQRLDSNQEFVGQGLANVAAGFFGGYPVAGSFSRSAVNLEAGALTPMASIFSGLFVLAALLAVAPLAAYIPLAALAGVLIVTGFGIINTEEMARIWRGVRQDAIIMVVTFIGTLVLNIEFAVLLGILISFALYIYQTSLTEVEPVLPDATFSHFTPLKGRTECPQITVMDISGDLYFGAVNNIEQSIDRHVDENPNQHFLLLRMNKVNHIDFSGIYMLENVVRTYRQRGGDVFLQRVNPEVRELMNATGFSKNLGERQFLEDDNAISHVFYHVLDPAICIYECPVRAFQECQNLPKHDHALALPAVQPTADGVPRIDSRALWERIRERANGEGPLVMDVREPREFQRGHVPTARSQPLSTILTDCPELPHDRPIVVVCRTGRRSARAADALRKEGYDDVTILDGGVRAWEAEGLLEAVDY